MIPFSRQTQSASGPIQRGQSAATAANKPTHTKEITLIVFIMMRSSPDPTESQFSVESLAPAGLSSCHHDAAVFTPTPNPLTHS